MYWKSSEYDQKRFLYQEDASGAKIAFILHTAPNKWYCYKVDKPLIGPCQTEEAAKFAAALSLYLPCTGSCK